MFDQIFERSAALRRELSGPLREARLARRLRRVTAFLQVAFATQCEANVSTNDVAELRSVAPFPWQNLQSGKEEAHVGGRYEQRNSGYAST